MEAHPSSARLRDQLLLTALTFACLLPFSNKPFNVDDVLFVAAARQIRAHALDPYGFQIVWYTTAMPMAEVTKNPPLASYYGALVTLVGGGSEIAWHLGFLAPALALVLGTYRLAERFTGRPLLAAVATLATPVFLISASGVMCDVTMLALWVWATILWTEGLEPLRPARLASSAVLMAAAALSKYFGAAVIPLLLVYSLARQRRMGKWAWFLAIPVAALTGYHFWTAELYGHGLLSDAAVYAHFKPESLQLPVLATTLVGLSFTGGCVLTALTFAPWLWSRWEIAAGAAASGLAGFIVGMGWINLRSHVAGEDTGLVCAEMALFIAGGISLLGLAGTDLWKRRDAESLLLTLWVAGTFLFAVYVNWTVNGRSILPMIPAAGILIARRWEETNKARGGSPRRWWWPAAVAGVLSLWMTWGDAGWASSQKLAAELMHDKTAGATGTVWFAGHWGLQYYMQAEGGVPVDVSLFSKSFRSGDFIVLPKNNTNTFDIAPGFTSSRESIVFPMTRRAATMCPELGAGFYSSAWGPLPFAVGKVTPERYTLLRLKRPQ